MSTFRRFCVLLFLPLLLSASAVAKPLVVYLAGGGRATHADVDRDHALLMELITEEEAYVWSYLPSGTLPLTDLKYYTENDFAVVRSLLWDLNGGDSQRGTTVHFLLVSGAVRFFTTDLVKWITERTNLRVGTVVSVLPLWPYAPRPALSANFPFDAWLEINHPMSLDVQWRFGANRTSSANDAMQRRIHYVEVAGYGTQHTCYNAFRQDQLLRDHGEQIYFWIQVYARHWLDVALEIGSDAAARFFESQRVDIEYKGPRCSY